MPSVPSFVPFTGDVLDDALDALALDALLLLIVLEDNFCTDDKVVRLL